MRIGGRQFLENLRGLSLLAGSPQPSGAVLLPTLHGMQICWLPLVDRLQAVEQIEHFITAHEVPRLAEYVLNESECIVGRHCIFGELPGEVELSLLQFFIAAA